MFTKTAFGLAIILATASTALAATRDHSTVPAQALSQNVYNPAGAYVGSDPDSNVRFELRRDWGRGQ